MPLAGRFPTNDIISLLDVNRRFNLAESTTRDMTVGELLRLTEMPIDAIVLGYGRSAGLAELCDAVGRVCGVPSDTVVATQGAVQALLLVALEVCRAGDEIILATPCFPPARDGLAVSEATVRTLDLAFDDRYRIDLDRFTAMLSPRTKLVSLASPQNPSGVRIPEDTLRDMLRLMAEQAPDALLFVDETYNDATYEPATLHPSAAAIDPRVVAAGSLSKAYGVPGLRVGWLTVPDAGLRARLVCAKMNISISGSVLTETLGARLLERRATVLEPRRQFLSRTLGVVERWIDKEQERVEWVRPDAGALCCVRLRADRFDEQAVARFWSQLAAHGVQLAPGSWFGESDRVFRLGFGYLPLERLEQALSALSDILDEV